VRAAGVFAKGRMFDMPALKSQHSKSVISFQPLYDLIPQLHHPLLPLVNILSVLVQMGTHYLSAPNLQIQEMNILGNVGTA
jgi:hypothetical protein